MTTIVLKTTLQPHVGDDILEYHGEEGFEEYKKFVLERIVDELGKDVRGTITKSESLIFHPDNFIPYYELTFVEDARNSYENLWGLVL